jgi:hypothetical protein
MVHMEYPAELARWIKQNPRYILDKYSVLSRTHGKCISVKDYLELFG